MQRELKVDLTNCDKEPIHIPGYIQPHGFLLALNVRSLLIEKVTENIKAFINIEPVALPTAQYIGVCYYPCQRRLIPF